MKIPMVIDIDINVEAWAEAIGFHVDGDHVVSEDAKFSMEDFEENIREYVRDTKYLSDPNGFWLKEKFFTDETEQELFKESLFDNFEPL